MSTKEVHVESKVSDRGTVTIPVDLRRQLDLELGDKLRWNTDEEGNLSVEVVKQRYGTFEDDDMKAPMGGDSLETHDLAGGRGKSIQLTLTDNESTDNRIRFCCRR